MLTYEDLEEAMAPDPASPDGPFVELVDGALRYDLSPRWTHGFCQGAVAELLFGLNRAGGGWWILVDVDVRFSQHRVLRPDVSGWRRERMPDPVDGPAEIAPDWICEVVSPSHEAFERGRKADMYAEEGVSFLWLIHQNARILEVFRLLDRAWLRVGAYTDGDRPVLPPFAREVDVSSLLPPLPTVIASGG